MAREEGRSSLFRVLLRMNIRPGMEQEFEQTWHRVGSAIAQHPANLGHWLCRCTGEYSTDEDSTDEDSVYYIISDWVDEPRFREFEHSAAHVEHRTKLHPFRSSGSMATMQVVYEITGAAASAVTGG
jgi:heme-degrading monooxygenase HmoA